MIITELQGGLGNQLFQYAMARALAEKHKAKLLINLVTFQEDVLRNYELSHFNIHESFIDGKQVLLVPRHSNFKKKFKLWVKSILLQKKCITLVTEQQFNFDKTMLNLPDNLYLRGYWQAEKYFKDIAPIIQKEFTLKKTLTEASQLVSSRIKASSKPSVSIHIRRGDYVTNPDVNATHGICSLDYYYMAVDYLQKKLGVLDLFIFSDDRDWVKAHLDFNHSMTFVDHNDAQTAYEDMYLMSLCQHNIIANSSFSWWGAWLNSNLNKIVIAPQKWFELSSIKADDICPESWVRL